MTDELKKAIENANTEEERKAVAEKFMDEIQQLSDEELEEVAGGAHIVSMIDPEGMSLRSRSKHRNAVVLE